MWRNVRCAMSDRVALAGKAATARSKHVVLCCLLSTIITLRHFVPLTYLDACYSELVLTVVSEHKAA